MRTQTWAWRRWIGAGLLLGGTACSGSDNPGADSGPGATPSDQLRTSDTSLLRADSCADLLTKIQDDAIAKLDLALELAKTRYAQKGDVRHSVDDAVDAGSTAVGGGVVGGGGTSAPGAVTVDEGVPALPPRASAGADGSANSAGSGTSASGATQGAGPQEILGASDTNTQVEGVDEADFVKLVDSGKGMFLLHGNTLLRLKTYPPEDLSIEAPRLEIEGSPSELFVTDDGRAVIFSSVYGYGGFGGPGGIAYPAVGVPCGPEFCGGYAGNITKITLADVSGESLTTLRELYFQGGYVSSRRYGDVVRVVLQSYGAYSGLYEPDVDAYDAWGRPYPKEEVFAQLAQWRERVASSIRNTELTDWVPVAKEAKDKQLVDVAPDCDAYFVPQPGLAEGGLVHVLSLDTSKDDAPLGGVTIMGQASTVYSNLDRLVLAQPDYRFSSSDFGFIDQQRTSLHVFGLSGSDTTYLASGWVSGQLPRQNQQFGLDVDGDHVLRVATTGQVRANPDASPEDPAFWQTRTENRVSTLRQQENTLELVGASDPLGHEGESVQSARFVEDRAYVVTARNKDPLIVLDLSDASEPVVLGEIEIPGFSQYVHPLDAEHLITFGDSGSASTQLQLFDVSDPLHIPEPKRLDFGGGSSSETSYSHKAFTFYAPESLIALPVTANRYEGGMYSYLAALRVIRVDAEMGFTLLGSVDHSDLYANPNGGDCVSYCDAWGCKDSCGYYGGGEVRRGHFVEDSDATYVYAISTAGVSVSDLDDPKDPIVEVKLPAMTYSQGPWYASGSTSGAGSTGIGVATPGTVASPPKPSTMPETAAPVDAGLGSPVAPTNVDGGRAMPVDAGVEAAADGGMADSTDADGGQATTSASAP